MSVKPRVLVVCLVLALATVASRADVVHTTDGSRIVGHIEQIYEGKLIIVTEIAGKLEIDVGKIKAIATDDPVTAQFTSGDRLVGSIEILSDDSTVMDTSLGRITVDTGRVDALWPQGAPDPHVVAVQKKAKAEREALRPKWSATLEAGSVMKEGNTDQLDARGRFDVKRRTPSDLLEFYVSGDYSEQEKVRTKNEYRGGIRYENKLNERWYWYTRMELEFDEFEDLDLRATAAAGAGYYWIKKEAQELKTSAGLGLRHEAFNTGKSNSAAVIDLGLNYRADLAPWAQFTHAGMLTPDIEDFGDYRLDLDTALIFPLKYEAWKLKVGMRNEYNSRPQRGIERLDNTYYANILLELK